MNKNLNNNIENIIKGETDKKENDIMLNLAKSQGYVKDYCILNGQLVIALINEGKNPCNGCNLNCKGVK